MLHVNIPESYWTGFHKLTDENYHTPGSAASPETNGNPYGLAWHVHHGVMMFL